MAFTIRKYTAPLRTISLATLSLAAITVSPSAHADYSPIGIMVAPATLVATPAPDAAPSLDQRKSDFTRSDFDLSSLNAVTAPTGVAVYSADYSVQRGIGNPGSGRDIAVPAYREGTGILALQSDNAQSGERTSGAQNAAPKPRINNGGSAFQLKF